MPAVIAVIDAEGPERDARPVAYAPGSCSRPARLAQPLRGAPRIARVVAGLSRCAHLAGVAVVATEETLAVLAPLLAGLCWRPVPLNTGPAAPLPSPDLRRLRRFAARAWRVGPAGAFAFEEEARPEAVVAAIAAFAPTAHAALIVPPLAMLVDPALADRMAAAFLSRQPEGGILLCGAPPGFDYAVLSASAAREGAARGAFPTAGLCLDLSGGAPDIELTDAYFPLPQRVVACRGRFLLDSVRGEEAAERFLDFAGARPDLAPIDAAAAFMEAEPLAFRGRLPRLVTVEVCSAVEIVPLWHPARWNPAAVERARRRATMPPALFERLMGELAGYDDICLTLGGLGDPLLHPEFPRLLTMARAGGVHALSVETSGLALTDAALAALLDAPADAVAFSLDALSAATYKAITGRGDAEAAFARAVAAVERCFAAVRSRGAAAPVVLPVITKSRVTEPEVEPFFDTWTRAVGAALVRPVNPFSGRLPDERSIALHLAPREPCLRLAEEMYVLPDGGVPLCREEFDAALPGARAAGVAGGSLSRLWTGGAFLEPLAAHARGEFPALCGGCARWDTLG